MGQIEQTELIHQIAIDRIINDSISEKIQVLRMIEDVFPNIDDHINIFNLGHYQIDNIRNFEYSEDSKLKGRDLLTSLLINTSQQFCFWLNPNQQTTRVLSSSDFYGITWENAHEVINKSVTLRKERISILNNLWKIMEAYSSEYLHVFMEDRIFNHDFFRKKKNLFLMCLVRMKEHIPFEPDNEFIHSINPAIDYQIPKILRGLEIISYPKNIADKVDAGELIVKDSYEELFIRSVSYKALIKIQEEFKLDQVKLDGYFWYNRKQFLKLIGEDTKHHCTITEDY